jgi:hypothetical protein
MSAFEDPPAAVAAPALGLVAERLAAFERGTSFRLRSGSTDSKEQAAAAELLNKERRVSNPNHHRCILCIEYEFYFLNYPHSEGPDAQLAAVEIQPA